MYINTLMSSGQDTNPWQAFLGQSDHVQCTNMNKKKIIKQRLVCYQYIKHVVDSCVFLTQ